MAAFLLSLFQNYHLHVISVTTTTSQHGCTAYCTVIETIKFPWLPHVYIYSYIYWLNSPPQWGTMPPWGETHSLPYKDSWPIRMHEIQTSMEFLDSGMRCLTMSRWPHPLATGMGPWRAYIWSCIITLVYIQCVVRETDISSDIHSRTSVLDCLHQITAI